MDVLVDLLERVLVPAIDVRPPIMDLLASHKTPILSPSVHIALLDLPAAVLQVFKFCHEPGSGDREVAEDEVLRSGDRLRSILRALIQVERCPEVVKGLENSFLLNQNTR